MTEIYLEHVNLTVSDPDAAAQTLTEIFNWRIRWSGPSMDDGRTVHVGGQRSYVAFYSASAQPADVESSYRTRGAVNHVAVVVDNLEEIEKRVVAAGLSPHSHQTYEPGSRFYFDDREGIEYEVVSYS